MLSNNKNRSRERSLQRNNQTFTNDLFDPESGQPYFKPKICRGPKTQHRPDPR